MSTKNQEMQKLIRYYKDQTGSKEVDMHKVAEFAIAKLAWKLPEPPKPTDLLAKQLSRAARQETRHDKTTGRPYRANHAFPVAQGSEQLTLWVDIEEATRPQMWKSAQKRREQMVGDGYQLTLDTDHWNNINPAEEPIAVELDFTDDIEWRKNGPEEQAI